MIGYLFFRFFVLLIRFTPFWLLYRFSDGLAWLFNAFGYRQKVVWENLNRCFPEKSEAEKKQIAKESYRNLSDITLESLKSMTLPVEKLHQRITFRGQDDMNRYLDKGQSVLLLGSHYCNWEWGVITVARHLHAAVYGVYKPLSNKPINDFLNAARERDGMRLVTMRDTFAKIEAEKEETTVFCLIADQSPSNRKRAIWADFFGHETPCLSGPEVLSKKYNTPVFHYQFSRKERGVYVVDLVEICAAPKDFPEGEVIQLYMNHLRKAIEKEPAAWLWSHRRWKYSRKEVSL